MRALVVCPTYGRLPYLGRLVASFINQTYDDKHLVIINDDVNVNLHCDINNVTILNHNKRLSVGQKRNLGISEIDCDIVHPWDDDDIFYPKRLENHMKHYADVEVNAYRNLTAYTIYGDHFDICGGGINDKSYRKTEFLRVDGYQSLENFGEDLELSNKLQGFKREIDENNRDFLYGFSTSNYHLCNKPSPQRLEEIAHQQLKQMGCYGKKFYIEPDLDQYKLYLKLDELYRKNHSRMKVNNLEDGKIDISHLL